MKQQCSNYLIKYSLSLVLWKHKICKVVRKAGRSRVRNDRLFVHFEDEQSIWKADSKKVARPVPKRLYVYFPGNASALTGKDIKVSPPPSSVKLAQPLYFLFNCYILILEMVYIYRMEVTPRCLKSLSLPHQPFTASMCSSSAWAGWHKKSK